MFTFEETLERIITCQERLRTCQYVGEICLDEHELIAFANSLTTYKSELSKENQDVAILVLAVNIAYYHYDDNGFWYHFCMITGNENTENVGKSIEKILRRFDFLKVQRFGPFRYVGAILEQCGVSKRYIPSFASVLKEINRRYSRRRIQELKYSDIVNILKDFQCAKYLKDFLLDEEGALFTLQVLKNINMYQDGIFNKIDLITLDGFRPGFWEEIVKHFEIKSTKKTLENNYLKPQLRLNIKKLSVELVFPGMPFFEGMIGREEYTYPATQLTKLHLLKEKFSGTITAPNMEPVYWEIPGWKPSNHIILFDSITRNMIPANWTLPPGHYYLLAPKDYRFENDITAGYIGELDCSTINKYSVHKVRINYGDKLAGVKILAENDRIYISINFRNPEDRLFRYHEGLFDVFVGDLPDLEVSDFGPIEKNIVGLFYDFGKIKGRIKQFSDLDVLKEKINRNLPLKGRIWTEVIVRNTFHKSAVVPTELIFYVIPDLKIIGADRFFGLGSNPSVIIKEDKKLHLEIQDASVDGSTYTFPTKTQFLVGKLMFEEESIEFRIPFRRIGILYETGRVVWYLEKTEINTGQNYIVWGHPNTEVELHYSTGGLLTKATLDDNGKSILKGEAFLNAVSDSDNVGVFSIQAIINEESIPLGSYVLDSYVIFQNIDKIPMKSLIGPIRDLLDAVARIHANPLGQVIRIGSSPSSITAKFDEKIHDFFYCAQTFDNTHFQSGGVPFDWHASSKNQRLKRILQAYRTGVWEEDVSNFHLVIPGVERWGDYLELYIKKNAPEKIYDVLQEWSKEVKSFNIVALHSSMALKPYGRSLTQAWSSYLRDRMDEALNRLSTIPDDCGDLIFDLRDLLRIIIYIRNCRFKQAENLITKPWQTKTFVDIKMLIESILYRLRLEPSPIESRLVMDTTQSLLEVIPLRDDDLELMKNYILYLEDKLPHQNNLDSRSWLSQWLYLSLFHESPDVTEIIASRLSSLTSNIPQSQEKTVILDKISNLLRRD